MTWEVNKCRMYSAPTSFDVRGVLMFHAQNLHGHPAHLDYSESTNTSCQYFGIRTVTVVVCPSMI